MKRIGFVGLLAGVLFIGVLMGLVLGCSGGLTERDKEYIETAMDANQARVQEIVDGYRADLDDQSRKVREYIKYETDDIWARTNESNQKAIETMGQNQHHLVKAICETDYWVTTMLSMLSALLRDDATIDEVNTFFEGILIDATYPTTSGVCQPDGDRRWVLVPQPDKILPHRFE